MRVALASDHAGFSLKEEVKTLLGGGSDPVISKEPVGAWTHAVTDKALN